MAARRGTSPAATGSRGSSVLFSLTHRERGGRDASGRGANMGLRVGERASMASGGDRMGQAGGFEAENNVDSFLNDDFDAFDDDFGDDDEEEGDVEEASTTSGDTADREGGARARTRRASLEVRRRRERKQREREQEEACADTEAVALIGLLSEAPWQLRQRVAQFSLRADSADTDASAASALETEGRGQAKRTRDPVERLLVSLWERNSNKYRTCVEEAIEGQPGQEDGNVRRPSVSDVLVEASRRLSALLGAGLESHACERPLVAASPKELRVMSGRRARLFEKTAFTPLTLLLRRCALAARRAADVQRLSRGGGAGGHGGSAASSGTHGEGVPTQGNCGVAATSVTPQLVFCIKRGAKGSDEAEAPFVDARVALAALRLLNAATGGSVGSYLEGTRISGGALEGYEEEDIMREGEEEYRTLGAVIRRSLALSGLLPLVIPFASVAVVDASLPLLPLPLPVPGKIPRHSDAQAAALSGLHPTPSPLAPPIVFVPQEGARGRVVALQIQSQVAAFIWGLSGGDVKARAALREALGRGRSAPSVGITSSPQGVDGVFLAGDAVNVRWFTPQARERAQGRTPVHLEADTETLTLFVACGGASALVGLLRSADTQWSRQQRLQPVPGPTESARNERNSAKEEDGAMLLAAAAVDGIEAVFHRVGGSGMGRGSAGHARDRRGSRSADSAATLAGRAASARRVASVASFATSGPRGSQRLHELRCLFAREGVFAPLSAVIATLTQRTTAFAKEIALHGDMEAKRRGGKAAPSGNEEADVSDACSRGHWVSIRRKLWAALYLLRRLVTLLAVFCKGSEDARRFASNLVALRALVRALSAPTVLKRPSKDVEKTRAERTILDDRRGVSSGADVFVGEVIGTDAPTEFKKQGKEMWWASSTLAVPSPTGSAPAALGDGRSLTTASVPVMTREDACVLSAWQETLLWLKEELLKCVSSLSMCSVCLDALQEAGVIPAVVPFLAFRRTHPWAMGALFYLCRINRARQEQAALSGIVPHLLLAIRPGPSQSRQRQFALPMLCDLAYCAAAGAATGPGNPASAGGPLSPSLVASTAEVAAGGRGSRVRRSSVLGCPIAVERVGDVLWQNDCARFFLELMGNESDLSLAYWRTHALSSLAVWLQADMVRPMLPSSHRRKGGRETSGVRRVESVLLEAESIGIVRCFLIEKSSLLFFARFDSSFFSVTLL